jgi:cleavage and polyadenylation specificity factor subunit 3
VKKEEPAEEAEAIVKKEEEEEEEVEEVEVKVAVGPDAGGAGGEAAGAATGVAATGIAAAADDQKEDTLPAVEPEGLSVNGGALTILKRVAGAAGVEHALITWCSDPLTDMIADAVLSVILQLEQEPAGLAEAEGAHQAALAARDKAAAAAARLRIVAAMLGVQFGEPVLDVASQTLSLRVDGVDATVRYASRDVDCDDGAVKARMETALERIDMAIADSSLARTLPSVSGLSGSASRGGAGAGTRAGAGAEAGTG